MFTVNRNPTPNDLRKFGRAMLIGFGTIGLLLWIMAWRKFDGHGLMGWSGTSAQIVAVGSWAMGIGLFAMSLVSPALTRPVYITWMAVTLPIGIAMSTILLTLLFVFLLPFFSLIVRMGDPLRKRLGGASYWEDYRPHEHTLERMKRFF